MNVSPVNPSVSCPQPCGVSIFGSRCVDVFPCGAKTRRSRSVKTLRLQTLRRPSQGRALTKGRACHQGSQVSQLRPRRGRGGCAGGRGCQWCPAKAQVRNRLWPLVPFLGASFLWSGVKDVWARDSKWSRFVYDGEYEVIISGFLRHGWGSAVM